MLFRLLLIYAAVAVISGAAPQWADAQMLRTTSLKSSLPGGALHTEANVICEIVFTAQRTHPDPSQSVVLDVVFTDPAGQAQRVPAFWAGGSTWKVRYASP